MTFLLIEIFVWLLAAALIGAVAGWFLRRTLARRREAIIQNDWRDRMREAELNRERIVHRLSDEIETLKGAAGGAAGETDPAVLADYENLILTLEERVAEREGAIGEQRAEIQALRSRLAEVETAARERETGLRQQIDALGEELERSREAGAGERDRRIESLESSLRERDESLAGLTGRLSDMETTAEAREKALRERHEREVSALRIELEQAAGDTATKRGDAARIRQLEQDLRQRDDSIAVLRDDLAELVEHKRIEQRGRQDERLRGALKESMEWQKKYEAAAADLVERDRRLAELEDERSDTDSAASVAAGAPAKRKRRRKRAKAVPAGPRSASERIGSVLERPPGPRDNLQEIRGIGPVLEKLLNELGIFHYHQIAGFGSGDVGRVSREIGRFGNRIERDDWVSQARDLHRKYHG